MVLNHIYSIHLKARIDVQGRAIGQNKSSAGQEKLTANKSRVSILQGHSWAISQIPPNYNPASEGLDTSQSKMEPLGKTWGEIQAILTLNFLCEYELICIKHLGGQKSLPREN